MIILCGSISTGDTFHMRHKQFVQLLIKNKKKRGIKRGGKKLKEKIKILKGFCPSYVLFCIIIT